MNKQKLVSDPRMIYVLLALVVTVPILAHSVLPVPISDTTRAVFDYIDKLPANSLVVLSFDYSTSVVPELHPQAIVVTQHVFLRPLKVIFVAQYTDGPALADAVLDAINKGNKQYGVDYATLGYIPNSATVVGMTTSFQQYFPVDTRGTSTNDLPIIREFPAAKMTSLLVSFSAGDLVYRLTCSIGKRPTVSLLPLVHRLPSRLDISRSTMLIRSLAYSSACERQLNTNSSSTLSTTRLSD